MNKIIRLPLALSLLLTGTTSVALARSPQLDTVLVQQQKGRLWTVAFQQGWSVAARNQQWATSTQFYTWLDGQTTAIEEVKQLRADVRRFIKSTYGHDDATPAELANALEIQLLQLLRQKKKPFTAVQQATLHKELTSATIAATQSPVNESTSNTSPTTGQPLPDQETASKDVIPITDMNSKTPPKSQENNSYLYGLGGLLLGFGGGFLFGRRSSRSRGSESTTSYLAANANKEKIEWPELQRRTTAPPPADAWSEKPATENKSQRKQVPAEVLPTVQSKPETPSTETGHSAGTEILFDIPPVDSVASTNLYGPAPDTPSIEARKLTPQSFPQMPICLRLANAQATVGSFVLNPHAEQSRLIGNGIRELKAFFDFDLPLPDNFSNITTSRPGKMELRNGTWHLVEKAKIELK